MLIYTICSVLLLCVYLIGTFIKPNKRKRFYFISSFLLFFIVMGFRNDYANDYNNYVNVYLNYGRLVDNYGLLYFFESGHSFLELGFTYLCVGIYKIFGENYLPLFLVSSVIILYPLWKKFESSHLFVFTVFLYLTIGTYFESFNIMRQMMAASIFFLAVDFVRDKHFFKYAVVVIIASLFHKSSLLMLPLYFVLIEWDNKWFNGLKKYICILGGVVVVLQINSLISFYIDNFHDGYFGYAAGLTQISWKNILFPLILYIPCIIFNMLEKDKMNNTNELDSKIGFKTSICANGAYIWIVLEICCIFVPMATRFASFLSPYFLIYVSDSVNKAKNKFGNAVLIIVVLGMFFLRLYLARNNDLMNNYHLFFH